MTKEAYDEVVNAPHKAKLSHQLIAAAASYEAVKSYNEYKEKKGEEVPHAMAKELIAGFAGAFIDRMVETKGFDAFDDYKAKRDAEERNEKHFKHHGY